jgi:hypothetical protein
MAVLVTSFRDLGSSTKPWIAGMCAAMTRGESFSSLRFPLEGRSAYSRGITSRRATTPSSSGFAGG